jgi:high-affinity iron transporter
MDKHLVSNFACKQFLKKRHGTTLRVSAARHRAERKFWAKVAAALALVLLSLTFIPLQPVAAQGSSPAQSGEEIRTALFQAQVALSGNEMTSAQQAISTARKSYEANLAGTLTTSAPEVNKRIMAGFTDAEQALNEKNGVKFALARSDIWTALLAGAYQLTQQAIHNGNGQLAQEWLGLREFRQSTRFTRPNTDATLAVEGLINKKVSQSDALLSVQSDLLDTYQARLVEALHDLETADTKGFYVRRAELAGLVEGYFSLLTPAYTEQRGQQALEQAKQAFADLRKTSLSEQKITGELKAIDTVLHNFRAAPLSAVERSRRIGQLTRFLSLIAVEYGRGVNNSVVTRDLEIREAMTFRDGAEAAFNDLQNLLDERNSDKTKQLEQILAKLETQLNAASNHKPTASPADIQAQTDRAQALLKEIIPADWQQQDSTSNFDVISTLLDQMIAAVAKQDYALAEASRLEAYSVLESGPEARLRAFAPQMITPLEDLFWYGQGEHKGLALLISQKASLSEIKASRRALDAELAAAQEAIKGDNTPVSVATNASIIVFREGLEAVLILASLMGSMKRDEMRKYKRPLWLGAGLAFLATVLTWILMQGILASLARYGEILEAVVSLIAIGVLLLITNWFFHKVYWTGWMARFHQQKKRVMGAEIGQWIGLLTLGFSSIYREGFETALFLQALVLESGLLAVLAGVGLGLLGTFAIGAIIFVMQVKLPYKKMLIVTGVMIGAVLLVMVGNTVHVMQLVGWLPIHPIGFIQFPYWASMWLGLYSTWEGILLQFVAGAFVLGSYFLAERQQKKQHAPAPTKAVKEEVATPVQV